MDCLNDKNIVKPLVFEKITKENISELLCKDDTSVLAISFAEIGAMGSSGQVEIVIRSKNWDLKCYTTNYQFGIFENTPSIDSWREEQKILFEYLPLLEKINFNGFFDGVYPGPIRGNFNYDIWKIIDMGFGNHLLVVGYVGDDLWRDYCDKPVGVLYDEWKQYIAQNAYQHKLIVEKYKKK